MEIEKIDGDYRITHDFRYWTFEELLRHINCNGHIRELVGFVSLSMEDYQDRNKMAKKITAVFDERESLFRRVVK